MAEWIKNRQMSRVLGLFILCLATQTHCFIHIKGGYWTTLKDVLTNHLEFMQQCNMHISYVGNGIFIEHQLRTTITYKIFGLNETVKVLSDSSTILLGELTHDESEALKAMLLMGTPTLSSISALPVKQESQGGPFTSADIHTTNAELPIPSTSIETIPPSTEMTIMDANTEVSTPRDNPPASTSSLPMTDGHKKPNQPALQSPLPKKITRHSVKNVSTKLTDECILDILNNQPKVLIKGDSIMS